MNWRIASSPPLRRSGATSDSMPGISAAFCGVFRRDGLVARKRSAADARQSHLHPHGERAAGLRAARPQCQRRHLQTAGGTLRHTRAALVESMRQIERLLGSERRARLHPAIAPSRRYRMGDPAAWSTLLPGIRLGRTVRGPGRGDRREIRAAFRPGARTLLDRGDGRRAGRIGIPGAAIGRCRQAPAPAGGTRRPRAWHGPAAGLPSASAFAREKGYKTITLWTQDMLHAAGHIYRKAGFRLAREEPHALFGIEMTGQIWELDL